MGMVAMFIRSVSNFQLDSGISESTEHRKSVILELERGCRGITL